MRAGFIALLLVLLAALATLQYRWAGQVSDGERERMRNSLRARSAQFAQDFDRELTRATVMFQSGSDDIIANPGPALADRYAQWAAAAPYPQLVGDVFVFEQLPGQAATLARLDRDNAVIKPAAWPPALERLRTHFDEVPKTPHPMPSWPELIDEQAPALVIPLIELRIMKDSAGEIRRLQTFDASSPRRLVVLMLDRDAMRKTILPALAARYFGGETGFDYHVAVIDRGTPPAVIYESDAWNAGDVSGADFTTGIMDIRMDELAGLATFSVPVPPGALAARIDRFALTIVRKPKTGEPQTLIKTGGNDSRWQLVLRHRAGSLEAAVQQSRTRNLLLSFGVLLLLALASAMVLVSTERARRLAAQQMEFVAGVSHELRTPVSVICAAADNLADGVIADNEHVRRYGNLIRVEGRRLADMLERVLELAGVMSGRRPVLAPTDVGHVIDEAVVASSAQIDEANVRVERDVPADLPPVLGDAVALRSAVQNLIANAVKYRGTGRVVRIGACVTGGSQPNVEVSVADEGVGIHPDDLPHIFDPFYRGRAAAAGQIRGTGVGLTVVKKIVEAHGGSVSATSRHGGGSVFTIRIPKYREESPRAPAEIVPGFHEAGSQERG
jgi:signal transduction histidine kinase